MKFEISDEFFSDEELRNTPERYRRFLEEWSNSKDFNFTTFPNPGYNQMVIMKDIEFYSLCSHHLLPFFGKVHIGYIPNKKICGLSKLARVVDMFAHKPQIQERMTQQIADFLNEKLSPHGVMVVVEAKHMCMVMRGIKKQNSEVITSALKGQFFEKEVREEFLRLIK